MCNLFSLYRKLHLKCLANLDDRGFTTGGEIPAMILTVRKSSMAYNAGLRNGDHILKVKRSLLYTVLPIL